jgi:hypothetical protein
MRQAVGPFIQVAISKFCTFIHNGNGVRSSFCLLFKQHWNGFVKMNGGCASRFMAGSAGISNGKDSGAFA